MWLNQRNVISLEVGNRSSMNFNNFTNCRYIPAYAPPPLTPSPPPAHFYCSKFNFICPTLCMVIYEAFILYECLHLTFLNDIYCQQHETVKGQLTSDCHFCKFRILFLFEQKNCIHVFTDS